MLLVHHVYQHHISGEAGRVLRYSNTGDGFADTHWVCEFDTVPTASEIFRVLSSSLVRKLLEELVVFGCRTSTTVRTNDTAPFHRRHRHHRHHHHNRRHHGHLQ